MCVSTIFISSTVAEFHLFGKSYSLGTICSQCNLYVILVVSHSVFKCRVLVRIVPVPGHFLFFYNASRTYLNPIEIAFLNKVF